MSGPRLSATGSKASKRSASSSLSIPSDRGVAVAIANWNGGEHIAKCLDALYRQTCSPNEIVVVDNGSTDGSPSLIRRRFPNVRLITRPVNEGFCAGYNRAIGATRHPFVLILNSDVFLDVDYIERALKAISVDGRVGWVAGAVSRANEEGYDFQGRFLMKRIALVNGCDFRDGEEVFAGSGAVIFCRREMLEDLAGKDAVYDESFFAYIEDLDLAWRAQHRGWRCIYKSDLTCTHIGSASQNGRIRVIDKTIPFLAHIIKNRYLTLVKNATPGILVRFLPVFIAGELLLWSVIGLRSPHKLRSIPEAFRLTLSAIPAALRARRKIMSSRVTTDRDILRLTRGM